MLSISSENLRKNVMFQTQFFHISPLKLYVTVQDGGKRCAVLNCYNHTVNFRRIQFMKKRTAARLGLIIIFAAACMFSLFSSMHGAASGSPQESHLLPVYVTDLGDVSGFSIIENGSRFTLIQEGDVWQLAQAPDQEIDQEMIRELAELLSKLPAQSMIREPEDLDFYGLADPALSFEITTAESTAALLVGDEVSHSGLASSSSSELPQYYASLSGGTLVYTIGPKLLQLTDQVLQGISALHK